MRYIYITTNLINGKRYLGQRKVPKCKTPQNDNYLGSGTLLLKAVKKYGKHNFTKDIIHICTTQKEADFLEIIEIREREILENKDLWYNRDAGGQYGRCERHIELTSIAMKSLYNSEKGKELKLKIINTKRANKGKPQYESILCFLIDKLNKAKHINNIKVKNKLNNVRKDIYKSLNKKRNELDSETKSNISKKAYVKLISKYPNIKDLIVEGRRKAHKEAKERGTTLFKHETRKKFALAKCKSSNNLLGYHIINNYDINYKLIERKVKKTYSKAYKNNDNLIKQLEAIRGIIYAQTNKDICLSLMLQLTHESLRNRGVM